MVDGTGAAAVFGGSHLRHAGGPGGRRQRQHLPERSERHPQSHPERGRHHHRRRRGLGQCRRHRHGSPASYNPTGLAFDPAGNLLVLDGGNSAIRRIDASGVVTTLSRRPGPDSSAAFSERAASSPSLPRADWWQTPPARCTSPARAIRSSARSVRSGTISTFAGSQTSGFVDGVGTAARFVGMCRFSSAFLSFDSSGNLYVTDNLSHRHSQDHPRGRGLDADRGEQHPRSIHKARRFRPARWSSTRRPSSAAPSSTPGGNFYVYRRLLAAEDRPVMPSATATRATAMQEWRHARRVAHRHLACRARRRS